MYHNNAILGSSLFKMHNPHYIASEVWQLSAAVGVSELSHNHIMVTLSPAEVFKLFSKVHIAKPIKIISEVFRAFLEV